MKDIKEIDREEEFSIICEDYLFPLVGVPFGGAKKIQFHHDSKHYVEFKDNNEIFVYESLSGDSCFAIQVSKFFPADLITLLDLVMKNINNVRLHNPERRIKAESYLHLRNEFSFIIQKTVCEWITDGHKKSNSIEYLISMLEDWKSKTYEGKNVNFAFVVDLDKHSNEKDKHLYFDEFLKEEYSATFSDGITSAIVLNQDLEFVKYRSITSEKIDHDYSVGPLRFADILNNFVDDKIGVILLTNGDIIIAKDKGIKLVKREGKWLNFSKDVFASFVSALLDKKDDELFKTLVEEIYLSALDVSFAHSGGIIAYILDEKEKQITEPNLYIKLVSNESIDDIDKPILHFIDNLSIGIKPFDELIKINDSYFNTSQNKKRMLKREFLQKVTGNSSFVKLDRRLRTELISMDGATIIKENGKLLAVGAIIQNDSGSYGGGRGAAARKLSNYGFAIKISTDGYIECYKGGDVAFRIK